MAESPFNLCLGGDVVLVTDGRKLLLFRNGLRFRRSVEVASIPHVIICI
jgi:hypothetical protein